MTPEMFLGGLMILTMVAGIVIAMTSSRSQGEGKYHRKTSPSDRSGRTSGHRRKPRGDQGSSGSR